MSDENLDFLTFLLIIYISKTRILVTHGITYLKDVDLIVVMKDGQISEIGTFKSLLDKKGDFADFLLLHMQEKNEYEVNEIGNMNVALCFGQLGLKRDKKFKFFN